MQMPIVDLSESSFLVELGTEDGVVALSLPSVPQAGSVLFFNRAEYMVRPARWFIKSDDFSSYAVRVFVPLELVALAGKDV